MPSFPDLPRRIREGPPLNVDNMRTWYPQGPEDYTDYPAACENLAGVQ